MSGRDDYRDDMDSSAQLTAFLAELHDLCQEPPPEPRGRLADLLDGAVPLPAHRPWRGVRRTALLLAAAVVALLLAAANHTLPAPAERVVTRVVDDITPFHLGSGGDASSLAPHPGPLPPSHRPNTAAPHRRAEPDPAEPSDNAAGSSEAPSDGAGSGPGDGPGGGAGDGLGDGAGDGEGPSAGPSAGPSGGPTVGPVEATGDGGAGGSGDGTGASGDGAAGEQGGD